MLPVLEDPCATTGQRPGQHDLLSLAAPSMSLAPTDDAGMIRGSPDDLPDAINVSRLSCAQEISDIPVAVGRVDGAGPQEARTQAPHDPASAGRARDAQALMVGVHGTLRGTEPPARFAVGPASLWLKAQLDLLASTLWSWTRWSHG